VSQANQSTPIIIGSLEEIIFPEFNNLKVIAKVDTGAYTGSLHSTKIREQVKDGQKILYFSPFDHPELEIETSNYIKKSFTSSNGHTQYRYCVYTRIILQEKVYQIMISLADRTEMKWPMLLGRRFLRKNSLLVDVTRRNV
jgi:hypothetical protein